MAEIGEIPRVQQGEALAPAGSATERLRALVDAHYPFVWRSLRRLGVPAAHVDDATQEVFCVAHRRLEDILPERDRAFLLAVAINIAADVRRRTARSREQLDQTAIDETASGSPNPEEVVDNKRARAQLDEVLDALGEDVRAVFVLAEIEGLTAPEIASLLDVPLGTVASRLRRGREQFHAAAKRVRARAQIVGGG